MKPRKDDPTTALRLSRTMSGLEEFVNQIGLERPLLELVKLRASLINALYCVDIHAEAARSLGETEQRLYSVGLWREAPFYTERERAAVAWTEAVTLVSADRVPDDVYRLARNQFTEKELINLTLAIAAINAWNRLAAAFRTGRDPLRDSDGRGAFAETNSDSRLGLRAARGFVIRDPQSGGHPLSGVPEAL
jgi:AhpD family alkylhydroperoxidase